MKGYAWLIDFAHFRGNCPTGLIPEWMQKVTRQNGTIQHSADQASSLDAFTSNTPPMLAQDVKDNENSETQWRRWNVVLGRPSRLNVEEFFRRAKVNMEVQSVPRNYPPSVHSPLSLDEKVRKDASLQRKKIDKTCLFSGQVFPVRCSRRFANSKT